MTRGELKDIIKECIEEIKNDNISIEESFFKSPELKNLIKKTKEIIMNNLNDLGVYSFKLKNGKLSNSRFLREKKDTYYFGVSLSPNTSYVDTTASQQIVYKNINNGLKTASNNIKKEIKEETGYTLSSIKGISDGYGMNIEVKFDI